MPDHAHGATGAAAHRKAEPGNDTQVGSPMPGVVSLVFVSPGQAAKAGDVLVSIEATKMETAIHAEKERQVSLTCRHESSMS
ncbi:biotin-requiring enzyme family protein (plasmid) [Ochrobactrum quorumnocens]|uniref:Biotin-requiring enzyme family protein n=1 Tax=Ochrobactrum quorumnocens TaxID=271865 RepID=A0A248UPE6_9HYPH|nr:biotin-requiring enzyme family protein [[Ochrobactrum] quorumnocens]